MTGFARSGGQSGDVVWQWEVKSVNGRGLDIRLRLAPGHEGLEGPVRGALAERFARGSFNVALAVTRAGGANRYALNRPLLDQLLEVAAELRHRLPDAAPAGIDGLLRVKGVLEEVEQPEDEATKAARDKAMLKSLETALSAIAQARLSEGAKLAAVLESHVARIAALTAQAAGLAGAQPAAIRARLHGKLAEMLAGQPGLPEERLAQEAALLAAKADVREELDRLHAHVAQARELLSAGGPVGRRLDFLSQEFNREANTLCSKAEDLELTRAGLELKATIEQFREQVQNVE